MFRKSSNKRYWLLYRKGEYYIKEGYRSNMITSLLMSQSTVIKSFRSHSKELATRFLVAVAWAHYKEQRKKEP